MPRPNGELTPQEKIFSERFAATGDGEYAAQKAGYAHPIVAKSKKLNDPAMMADIERRTKEKLWSAVPASADTVVDAITNPKYAMRDRLKAVTMLWSQTISSPGTVGSKEPHELTPEELAQSISLLERIASDKAKLINDVDANRSQQDVASIDLFA